MIINSFFNFCSVKKRLGYGVKTDAGLSFGVFFVAHAHWIIIFLFVLGVLTHNSFVYAQKIKVITTWTLGFNDDILELLSAF